MHPRLSLFPLLTLSTIVAIISCAGSVPSAPLAPSDPTSTASPDSANRYLWGFFQAGLDSNGNPALVPVRAVADHFNVLKFLEYGPCTTCVQLAGFAPSGSGTMLATVKIRHPFQTATLTGFDVRGICMFTGTHAFPISGLKTSDRNLGEGELVNAEGFTSLYNFGTAGSGPAGLQGYLKGKMATPQSPDVTLSGFKKFISPDPSNTRNAFLVGQEITQVFEIDMPNQALGFGYAVDACWVPPTTKPVTDPMTDFPSEANCPEPWKIETVETPIGDGLTDQGGQTKLQISVYDHQGSSSFSAPLVECPQLWTGVVTSSFLSDSGDFATYEATVGNTKTASAGKYLCLVSVEDNENGSAPPWLDLTAYKTTRLEVKQAQPDHHELWYYTSSNLLPDNSLNQAIQTLQQAAAAGYEKVLLSDFKMGTIDIQSQTYWDHVATFVQAAEDAGIEIVPSQVDIGYSDAVLCHDPNLIEGQPVVDAVFKVNGSTADIVQDPSTVVLNGGFENHSGDTFDDWIQMDGAGVETFADTSIKHSGNCSIRFENFNSDGNPNDRIRQEVAVKPWQCYAISFWIRTDNMVPVDEVRLQVFSGDFNETLHFLSFDIQETQDWTHYYAIFNSQDYTSAHIYIGVWGGQSGKFWVDDVTIENTGLINLVRRAGCPFVVTNASGTVTYQEGVDYDYVSDPLMGHAGSYTGTFDLYHDRPVINITPGSSINNGDSLLVDYYHCAFVYDLQPACCLVDDDVFDIFRATMTKVNELIHPTEVFIGVDELRCANWCTLCQGTGKTPGQILADATQRIDQIAHEVNPDWKLLTWSDMYDPNHNAHNEYYLVNGTLAGSWEGLPSSWDIGNWYCLQEPTLAFFQDRGNCQILCGFYDESGPNYSIDDWLDMSKPYSGVYGCMYTTWCQDFSKLEEWAQVVKDWDAANW